MSWTPCFSSSKTTTSALEQRAAVLGRLDTLRIAVEKAHADRVFQVRDRSGNGGLSGVQERGRLAHAAGLHHGHQHVEVVQLHPTSDAIAHLHSGTYRRPAIGVIEK